MLREYLPSFWRIFTRDLRESIDFLRSLFLPARRYASAGTSYGPLSVSVSVCLSVCLFVASRCSVKRAERINLVVGTRASFDQSYTVFYLQK